MEGIAFFATLTACAPLVHPSTAMAVVDVESGFNPFAIGVVNGRLNRQPRTRGEALATARKLQADGWNFSVGLAQINVHNFKGLGLTLETAFEPCRNLQAMQTILGSCFERASRTTFSQQLTLRRALSCYYSNNFTTGFEHGYVARVVSAATVPRPPLRLASSPATQTASPSAQVQQTAAADEPFVPNPR